MRCCSGSLAGPLWRGRPDLSTDFRWQTNLVQVDWIDVISLKELSETLLKLLMGFSVMVGMACACYVEPELVLHLPFPQHHRSRVSTSFLSACRIHWQPGTYSVVTVRSSKNALIFMSSALRCHVDVTAPEETLILKLLWLSMMRSLILLEM